jgi:hypothetical protein
VFPKEEKAGKLRLDGWRQMYIAGGQNGYAYAHVAGMAGATLIGNDRIYPWDPWSETGLQRAERQNDEDRQQLRVGLNAQQNGFTTTGGAGIPGYDPKHSLEDYIDEKRAELEGNKAGRFAGKTIEDVRAGRITDKEARQRIFDLLCVGQIVGVPR